MLAVAECVHLAQGEEGRFQRKPWDACLGIEKMRPGAETSVQLNDDGFAHRIDGRIRDLGKALAEEAVDRARSMGHGGQGSIVAHGPDGIFAVVGHGGQDHADVFPGKTEQLLQLDQIFHGRGESDRLQRGVRHQISVGGEAVKLLQQLFVFEQLVRVEIGDQHLSWAETAAVDDSLGIKVDQAGFRSGDHQRVFGEEETAGTQAVAIQGHSDQVPVSKGQGGRAVPGFNAIGVIAEKRGFALAAGRRQQHSDRFRDTAPVAR